MNRLGVWRRVCILFVICAATAMATPAQTFTTLVNFNGTNGNGPYRQSLVQGPNGNLYGTTSEGGTNTGADSGGTVFRVTPTGALTTLYDFCAQASCADGATPYGGLVLGTDGNFYGTTAFGGAGTACVNRCGTVFKITPSGALTTLHSFELTDGEAPYASLIQATNGSFYGTTFDGGTSNDGTVFRVTPAGMLTTLHSFGGTDGAHPIGALVQGNDGKFYGTTQVGGANGEGTVFKMTPAGALTTLHSFAFTDGYEPFAGLVQPTSGNFYGTTAFGGSSNACLNGCGTVFTITSAGALTTLRNFASVDGAAPTAAMVEGTDGNLYGTTSSGGANNEGTVFSVASGTLHSFDGTDGGVPYGGLAQATNGTFYGITSSGGTSGDGTIFSLAVGLGPFVETVPTSGKVGAKVIILGTNLTGATSVKFNGTAAAFTVVSKSEIKTTVPTGATTGTVKVVTPGGTLSSNVLFQVLP